jgi:molybdate transport system substrate-binding protein
MRVRILFLAALCVAAMSSATRAEGLRVLAAGSLREVVGEIGERYHKATGVEVSADFGPSGVLRERIERGERADLFASADMGHPLKLLADGRASRVAMFTRNAVCSFTAQKVGLTPANFLDRLLDPAVKLGTSTPKADPAGDYTWAMFHCSDPVAEALSSGKIDVMIGYCSGRKTDAGGNRRFTDARSAQGDRWRPGIRAGNPPERRSTQW